MAKTCFKCGESKPLDEFYRHPEMSDGHLGKCKDCARADVRANRRKNKGHYVEYERLRAQRPERKSLAAVYRDIQRKGHPEKYKARLAVSNALKAGRLQKLPCEECGDTKSEAHHDDYLKPLDVRWLCRTHHLEHHGGHFNPNLNGEAQSNAKR